MKLLIYTSIMGSLLMSAIELGAQTSVGDLALEVDTENPITAPPGSAGTLTFTVRNLGPDAVGNNLPDIRVGNTTLIEYPYSSMPPNVFFRRAPGESNPDCIVGFVLPDPAPDLPIFIFFDFELPGLLPGESASCEIEYLISPFAEGETLDVAWDVVEFDNDDPVPANNTALLTFQLRGPPVTSIPTLSPVGLAVLAGSILAGYGWVRSRQGALAASSKAPQKLVPGTTYRASSKAPQKLVPGTTYRGRSSAQGTRRSPVFFAGADFC